MNKNLVYIVSIDHNSSRYKFSDFSVNCIESWKYWCDKNNVDIIIQYESDTRVVMPIWNKEFVFDKFETDRYEKIAVVDSDTMIKWNAPNFFELYEDEFCGVVDSANLRWVNNSIRTYKEHFEEFKDIELPLHEYINAGVLMFHKSHKHVFDELVSFYLKHKNTLDNWNIGGVGKEQTIFNLMLKKLNVKKKLLSPEWNLISMQKRGMLDYNWQLNEVKVPFFINYSYIWHFTGIAIETKQSTIDQTWAMIKSNYQ